jgi:hypothetical protein
MDEGSPFLSQNYVLSPYVAASAPAAANYAADYVAINAGSVAVQFRAIVRISLLPVFYQFQRLRS